MTDDLAARLLDAQVEFTKNQLRGTGYRELVIDEVDHALELASELTLSEAVTPAMIKAVAAKYAVQVPLEGAIPEIVGEIAGRLYRNAIGDSTQLDEIIDSRSFDDLVTAISEMHLTHRIIRALSESEATSDTVATMLHSAAASVAEDAARTVERYSLTRAIAGAAARTLGPVLPAIGERADQATRRGVHIVLRRALDDGDEALAESIRDVWRRNRKQSLSTYRDLVSDNDIEDIVVLVFEFWRPFRETAFFHALLDEGIQHVFDKYGDTSLHDLLAELGVGRADMIEEAMRFGPPVIETLDQRGALDALIRRRLVPFFDSDEYRQAITGVQQ